MVDSGIKCDSSCTQVFCDLEHKKLEYIIMAIVKVDGKDKVVVKEQAKFGTSEAEMKESGENLKGATPLWHCFSRRIKLYPIAFGVCYVDYTTKDGRQVTKLPFIYWCNDNDTKVSEKMTYSSTIIPTSRKLATKNCTIHCGDDDEIEFAEVVQKLSKK